MTVLVRSASLFGFEALARSVGLDSDEQLRRVGLKSSMLVDPDALLPYTAIMALLERCALEGRCPDFGMRLAQGQDLGVFGPVTVLIRHASTIAEAVQLASKYIFVHSPALRLNVVTVPEDPGLIDIEFGLNMPNLPPCAQNVERSLVMIVQGLKLLSQGQMRPLRIMVPHTRISAAAVYRRVFDCECSFEAPVAAVRVPARDMRQRLPEHNPMLQELAKEYLEHKFGQPTEYFADHVRAALRRSLGTSPSGKVDVAKTLSMHPRTLQRRLADEGKTFDAVLDEVRSEKLSLLMNLQNPLPLAQVALMLGYSEHAALTRSCKRWFGCTPSQLRARRDAPPTLVINTPHDGLLTGQRS